ncbi:unnamed protein product [Haemonchus placei]|uniref:Uncharacterized protein n=1 Tax=Haemonchus placei TaxID=6290 RepID=A0A0N4W8F0_HAEPC|nr:unnamed protein product [Haemonchus placei]
MVGGQLDVAIVIKVEVVDDLLHCPSGCSISSVRTMNGSHLGLIIDKALAGFANAFYSPGGFGQHCREGVRQGGCILHR